MRRQSLRTGSGEAACLAQDEEPLEEGDRVEVVEVDGIRLLVKKKE